MQGTVWKQRLRREVCTDPRDLEGQLEEAVALAEGNAAQRREAEAKLRAAEARLEAAQVRFGTLIISSPVDSSSPGGHA